MRPDRARTDRPLCRSLDDPLERVDRLGPELVLGLRRLEDDVGRVADEEDDVGHEGAEGGRGEEELGEVEEGGRGLLDGGPVGDGEVRRW